MTVKEKARAYDKALERARVYHTGGSISDVHITEVIFPELKKSEDDRIREDLIQWIDDFPDSIWRGHNKKNIIAWLEKQGQTFTKKDVDDAYLKGIYDAKHEIEKQGEKPTDKVEPKFKVGDWITDGRLTCKVLGIIGKSYELHLYNDDYCHFETDIQSVNKHYRLWSIKDAKDGDVLAYVTDEEDLWIMIYWSLYEPYEGHVHYHALLVSDNFSDKGTCCICIDNLKPATKEQCDLLFQKIKEAGYVWDSEREELKKIEVASEDEMIRKGGKD